LKIVDFGFEKVRIMTFVTGLTWMIA